MDPKSIRRDWKNLIKGHPKEYIICGLYWEDSGPVLTVSLNVRHYVATAGYRGHLRTRNGDDVSATLIEGEDGGKMDLLHGANEKLSSMDKI